MDNYKNIIRCLKSSNMNTVNQAFEILYNEYAKLVDYMQCFLKKDLCCFVN